MARTKKEQFILTDKTYYEDLIWMSIRYCIGRKTIAAATHADDIARYSFNHLSENRRIFEAEDIRDTINSQIKFYKNLDFEGFNKRYTGLEKAAEWVSNNNSAQSKKIIIDGYNNEVYAEDYDAGDLNSIVGWQNDYKDYEPWIKLANALDKRTHKLVILDSGEIHQEIICFPFWSQYMERDDSNNFIGYKYELRWIPLDSYLERPFALLYAEPSYIKEIKDLL